MFYFVAFLGEPKERIPNSYWKGNPCIKRYDSNQNQKYKGRLLGKIGIYLATYKKQVNLAYAVVTN